MRGDPGRMKAITNRLKPALVSVRCMPAALMLPNGSPMGDRPSDNTISMTVSTRNRSRMTREGGQSRQGQDFRRRCCATATGGVQAEE